MADIAYGAFGLSEEFLRAGHTLHCIQMLEGLCAQMDPSQDVFPPILQVKCRLRLAMIYAKYTDNTEKAKDHLVRANTMCDDDDEEEENQRHQLTMKIMAHLGQTYTQLCNGTMARRSFKEGLDYAEKYCSTHSWNDMFWREYFRSRLALTTIYLGDHKAALKILNDGIKAANSGGQFELGVMYNLTAAQAELLRFTSGSAVEKYLQRAEKLIGQMVRSYCAERGDSADKENFEGQSAAMRDSVFASRPNLLILSAHHLIMQATYLLHVGDTVSLKKSLTQLQSRLQLLMRVSSSGAITASYEWMNHRHLFTVSLVLSAMFHRLTGRVKRVERVVAQTFGTIQSMLSFFVFAFRLDVPSEEPRILTQALQSILESLRAIENIAGNHTLDAARSAEVNLLLFLQLLLIQEKIIVHLSTCDFSSAAAGILEAIEALHQYPHMFERYRFNVHVLISMYASAVGEHDCSQMHLQLVMDRSPTLEMKTWAQLIHIASETSKILLLQESELNEEQNPTLQEELRRKKGKLFAELDHLFHANQETGHSIAEAAVFFLRGILCNSNDASDDAIKHLTESMHLCNDKIGNAQLLAQILLELGRTYLQKGNESFAEYVNNAFERSNPEDFIIRIPVSGLAIQHHKDAANLDKFRDALNKSVNELADRKQHAIQGDAHTVILDWISGKNDEYDKLMATISC